MNVPFERLDHEWRTRPDAPPSHAHKDPDTAGKPLETDHVAYTEDKRPLARRGAWKIGETEISPGVMPAGKRLARSFLPPGSRKWAAMVFVLMGVGGAAATSFLGPMIDKAMGSEQASAGQVTLVIRTIPSGATVTLDGVALEGTTPMAVSTPLAAGEHQVGLKLGDREPVESTITLAEGEDIVVVNRPLLEAGKIKVRTVPAGAAVFLDGQDMGPSPITLGDVSYGQPHRIEGKKEGYETASIDIPLDRPAKHAVKLALTKKGGNGRVIITSNPTAQMRVDGEPVGATGLIERQLPVGEHDVMLVIPGLDLSASYQVTIPESGVAKYYFDLTPAKR